VRSIPFHRDVWCVLATANNASRLVTGSVMSCCTQGALPVSMPRTTALPQSSPALVSQDIVEKEHCLCSYSKTQLGERLRGWALNDLFEL
jgi:hypothetical protein